MNKKRILIISHDKIGSEMAGVGKRYHSLATALSNYFVVTIGVFNPDYIKSVKKDDISYNVKNININIYKKAVDNCDVIIALWLSNDIISYAKSKHKVLIFDLYDPVPVEGLIQNVFAEKVNKDSDNHYLSSIDNYSHFLRNGDFFLTSNYRQTDLWLGYAFASKSTYPSIESTNPIEKRFGECPMAIDKNELKYLNNESILYNKIPDLKKTDFIILWTGGIWDWFDAITPIKAIDILKKKYKKNNVKLVFLGTRHPNEEVPIMAETEAAREYSQKLGLTNKNVFFLDGWIPYNDRINYLSAGDIALYAHKPSIEARFSHRSRVLDHILMSLPTVATSGDYIADEIICKNNLGVTVPPKNAKLMAEAILRLQKNKSAIKTIKKNIEKIQPEFSWESTTKQLVDYIKSPNCKSSPETPLIITEHNKKTVFEKIKSLIPTRLKNSIKRLLRKND